MAERIIHDKGIDIPCELHSTDMLRTAIVTWQNTTAIEISCQTELGNEACSHESWLSPTSAQQLIDELQRLIPILQELQLTQLIKQE